MKRKTEEAHGWGLRVDGTRPYLGYVFAIDKKNIILSESYHRAVKVVLVPLSEWKKLKRKKKP